MATVHIEEAYVLNTFATRNGEGARVAETIIIQSGKRKGEEIKAYYTLWTNDEFDFEEGDTLTNISGELSTRVNEYEGKDEDGDTVIKRNVQTSLNNVTYGGAAAAGDDDEDEGLL